VTTLVLTVFLAAERDHFHITFVTLLTRKSFISSGLFMKNVTRTISNVYLKDRTLLLLDMDSVHRHKATKFFSNCNPTAWLFSGWNCVA